MQTDHPSLTLADIVVTFGGRTAVDALTMQGPAGQVTGLIGPNGAGKTTTFNAATGVVRPMRGHVELGGRSLDAMSVAARARAGLGRTFQRMRLFDTMSVRDNVALGLEARRSGRHPLGQLVARRRERGEILAKADEAIERCGIGDLSAQVAGSLSTGQQRLVELARALASDFRFLLLDEPSSGLDEDETEIFGQIVSEIAVHQGVGVLLVEHDMTLVRAVCAYCYAIDFGKLILDGPTDEVLASDVVRAAYLGEEVG